MRSLGLGASLITHRSSLPLSLWLRLQKRQQHTRACEGFGIACVDQPVLVFVDAVESHLRQRRGERWIVTRSVVVATAAALSALAAFLDSSMRCDDCGRQALVIGRNPTDSPGLCRGLKDSGCDCTISPRPSRGLWHEARVFEATAPRGAGGLTAKACRRPSQAQTHEGEHTLNRLLSQDVNR